MKILVPVKRVIDFNVKVRVKSDGSGVDLANVKMSMNPFDEIAVEEAVRIKERGEADRGRRRLDRHAAIAGHAAHRARHGRRPRHPGRRPIRAVEPLAVAKLLEARGREREARPGDHGQAGDRRRLQSDRPDAGRAARLAARRPSPRRSSSNGGKVEGGARGRWRARDASSSKLPAVVTTDLRLNEPRYASLPNIMKAKKKPIDETTPEALGVDIAPRLKVLEGRRAEDARSRHQGRIASPRWSTN